MADDKLLEHIADIVTAHVSNNSVAMGDLAGLIQAVHSSLARLGKPAAPVDEECIPAVSVRASIKPAALTCLDCGANMKLLKRHLMTEHRLTPAAYRERWKLPASYPMIAADYAARRKEIALSNGLGRKSSQAAKPAGKAASKTKSRATKEPRKQPRAAANKAAAMPDAAAATPEA